MCSLASSDGEKEEDSARKKMTVMGGGLGSWIDPGFLSGSWIWFIFKDGGAGGGGGGRGGMMMMDD